MTGEQLTSLTTLLMTFGGGVAWLIRRQAKKRDDAELAAKEQEKTEQAERIANTPALQQIVADQVQELLKAYAEQNKQLIEDNTDQRRRHAEDRRSWEAERKAEREEWQKQVLSWEIERRAWEKERDRLRKIIDELREELAPYRKKVDLNG